VRDRKRGVEWFCSWSVMLAIFGMGEIQESMSGENLISLIEPYSPYLCGFT
jgi:hypothetical protein